MFKLLEPFKLLMPNCMHELSYELQKLFLNYEFSGFINQLDGDMSSKFVQISCMPDKIFKVKESSSIGQDQKTLISALNPVNKVSFLEGWLDTRLCLHSIVTFS